MTIAAILLSLALILLFVSLRFFGFSSQKPEHYTGTEPTFSIKEHLSGPIQCEGMIYGPTGKVTTRFVAQMEGKWDGNTGTLSEDFSYSNGRKQLRLWHLEICGDNQLIAKADDIVGAGRGIVSGSTAKLQYTIELPKEAGGYRLDVTDWMYLAENGTILNRSEMRKFGIKVAELFATMRPSVETSN